MTPPHTAPSPSAPRVEGLDALRGVAAALVVMLHAAMPYLRRPMPGLIWPVNDVSSPTVDAVCWAIEGFIMPLFFLQAGVFAAGLLQRLSSLEFLKHRARRLLGPMALACLVILPLDFLVWTTGLLCDGRATWLQFQRMNFDRSLKRELYGFSHLWFLQYLFLWSAGLALARWLTKPVAAVSNTDAGQGDATVVQGSRSRLGLLSPFRKRLSEGVRQERVAGAEALRAPSPPHARLAGGSFRSIPATRPHLMKLVPGLTVVLVGLVLFWEPNIVVGFQHSFLPVLPKFAHAGLFFTFGVWLHGDNGRRTVDGRSFGPWLGAACLAFVVMFPLIHRQQAGMLPGRERAILAGSMAVYAVGMSLGLFGWFSTRVSRCPSALKRLAEASFWIYLAHHPLVGLLQIDLQTTTLTPEWKFVVVTLVTLALGLASYETLVRSTWVGAVLNGRRWRRPPLPPMGDTAGTVAGPADAASRIEPGQRAESASRAPAPAAPPCRKAS